MAATAVKPLVWIIVVLPVPGHVKEGVLIPVQAVAQEVPAERPVQIVQIPAQMAALQHVQENVRAVVQRPVLEHVRDYAL